MGRAVCSCLTQKVEGAPLLTLVFVLTLFLSAFLLFLVQPMFAKMVLPRFGGTPAVWNTCLVFFQTTLLAGYGYAHLTTKWLKVRRQAVFHAGLLLLPLLALPIRVPDSWVPPVAANPALSLLGLLLLAVGLPFFVVSTSAPLLQQWFAQSAIPMRTTPTSCTQPATWGACSRCSVTRSLLSRTSHSKSKAPCGALGMRYWWY